VSVLHSINIIYNSDNTCLCCISNKTNRTDCRIAEIKVVCDYITSTQASCFISSYESQERLNRAVLYTILTAHRRNARLTIVIKYITKLEFGSCKTETRVPHFSYSLVLYIMTYRLLPT